MTLASILAVGGYAPAHRVTNDELSQRMDTSDEWIRTRTGIRERRKAAPEQTTASLSAQAGRAALEAGGIDPRAVDWVLVCTDTPEMASPATACFVQEEIGATESSAIDLTGGCAGFLQTLELASGLAAQGAHILVIGTEVFTQSMDWTDRSTAVLFGDGSGAVLLGPPGGAAPRIDIEAALSRTDGTHASILGKPYMGTRNPVTPEMVAGGHHHKIYMEGPRVFRNAVQHMSDVAAQVLKLRGLSTDDVDWIIPHQANQRIIDGVANQLNCPGDKIFSHVESYANTGSASVALALADMMHRSLVADGQELLTVAFGAGFSWAAQQWTVRGLPPSRFVDAAAGV